METDTTALRCESCGMLVERLMTARSTVRSLSLGREIKTGEPICERCMQELQEELSEEEALRGPA